MSAVATPSPSTIHRGLRRLLVGGRRVIWIAGWPARTALLGVIAAYRATLSGVLGGHCRFEPSCSLYAAQAIRARGAVVGSGLAVWRIVRCNPFARGGADPAPSRRTYDNLIQGKSA
jgi:hypothetical protein